MRCIHCGADTDYKTREINGRKCSGCGQPFAFEPKSDSHRMTDVRFQGILNGVSFNGELFFTPRQLYYAFCRSLYLKEGQPSYWFYYAVGLVVSVAAAVVCGRWWLFPAVLVPWIIAVLLFKRLRPKPEPVLPIHRAEFETSYLGRWTGVHGRPAKLLDDPVITEPSAALPAEPEPDLESYSFERVVVTNRKDIAALLVANNVHFEGRCAVLSLDGYPEGRSKAIRQMLQRNPDLSVVAVHDCTPRSCAMVFKLREPSWFPGEGVRLFDLGLRPRNVWRTQSFTLVNPHLKPESLAAIDRCEAEGILTSAEAAWLREGRVCELDTFTPARIIRTIFRRFGHLGKASLVPRSDEERSRWDDHLLWYADVLVLSELQGLGSDTQGVLADWSHDDAAWDGVDDADGDGDGGGDGDGDG